MRPRGHHIRIKMCGEKKHAIHPLKMETTRTNGTSLSITTLQTNNIEIQLAYRHSPIELICSITFVRLLSFSQSFC